MLFVRTFLYRNKTAQRAIHPTLDEPKKRSEKQQPSSIVKKHMHGFILESSIKYPGESKSLLLDSSLKLFNYLLYFSDFV